MEQVRKLNLFSNVFNSLTTGPDYICFFLSSAFEHVKVKSLASIWSNLNNFHPLEVVDRVSLTQIKINNSAVKELKVHFMIGSTAHSMSLNSLENCVCHNHCESAAEPIKKQHSFSIVF